MVVFSAGPAADINRALTDDAHDYIRLAKSLWDCGTFGKVAETGVMGRMVAGWRDSNGTPPRQLECDLRAESFRTPGYPLFLAAASRGGAALVVPVLIQVLLGAGLAALAGSVAQRLGLSRSAARAVAVLWAITPALVVYDNIVATESLFNMLITVSLWFVAGSPTVASGLAAGTALGCASLVRPPLGLFYVPAIALIAWRRWPTWLLALVALGALAVPGAWVLRNHAQGEGARLATAPDLTLVFYTGPCVRSEAAGRDCDADRPRQMADFDTRIKSVLRPGQDAVTVARRLAVHDILEKPATMARVQLKSLVKLVVGHSMGTFYPLLGRPYVSSGLFSRFVLREQNSGPASPLTQLILLFAWTAFNAAIAVAASIGVVAAARQHRRSLLAAALVTIGLFAAASGSLGQERLRVPIMLPILLLVGCAAEGVGDKWRRRGSTLLRQ
jgi:hypothetical protein